LPGGILLLHHLRSQKLLFWWSPKDDFCCFVISDRGFWVVWIVPCVDGCNILILLDLELSQW
jgi:hypothetical protein